MDLRTQRRIASDILGIGKNRVWISPEKLEDVSEAITREDIRGLIADGIIKAKQKKGISRARIRNKAEKKALGRRKGHGSRKGAKGVRRGKKESWVRKIRAQRARLKELRDEGILDASVYKEVYRKARGGAFRSVSHMNSYLESLGVRIK